MMPNAILNQKPPFLYGPMLRIYYATTGENGEIQYTLSYKLKGPFLPNRIEKVGHYFILRHREAESKSLVLVVFCH